MRMAASTVPLAAFGLVLASGVQAQVAIDWVTIGHEGNLPDTRHETPGYGAVSYRYFIAKYEVANNQYTEFLNAVATLGDPNRLYTTNMGGGLGTFNSGGISRTGFGNRLDPWEYKVRPNRGNRPVNFVNWYDALRFANWLHNGQISGAQDASTTEDGAYDMSLGANVVRKPDARVFLPNEDEWYKAAYYMPTWNRLDHLHGTYFDFPTQSDTAPTAEIPPGTDVLNGSANAYDRGFLDTTYYTMEVGAYDVQDPPGSGARVADSAFGTFDQAGNLKEWIEADVLGDGSERGLRGGSFNNTAHSASATYRTSANPTSKNLAFGFRVAACAGPKRDFDHNGDGHVDLRDFALFQVALDGSP